MTRKDDIKEEVGHRIDEIKLEWYGKSCRTSLVAVAAFAAYVAKAITDHSESVYNALYVLFYGRMP